MGYVCCWRANTRKVGIENPQEIIEAQEKLLTGQIFKIKLTKDQKDKDKPKNNLLVLEFEDEKTFSFNDLLKYKSKDVEEMCFELIAKDQLLKDNPVDLKMYFKVKMKKYLKNEEEKIMVQVVDITKSVLYEEVYTQNQFLAVTNATVSHELRNPLQSISS